MAALFPAPRLQDGDSSSSSSSSSPSAIISTVHPDILRTHVLTLLDGPTLATFACASAELHALSTDDQLWRKICTSTWPSINHPKVSSVISTFRYGHRSFFSDSFPLVHHRPGERLNPVNHSWPRVTGLISAVDIYYRNVPIFSKVKESETVTGWFLSSPFRIELLETKEFVQTRIQHSGQKDSWLDQLKENITLSWILIDPKKKRAVNVSSQSPVSVQRHWLTGEVQVKFNTIMAGDGGGKDSERALVECGVVVTCGGEEGGEVHVRDIYMGMEDMEGRSLSGKDSLGILLMAMEGKRKKLREGKENYQQFLERKRERKLRIERKEKVLDSVCIATGIAFFLTFLSFLWLR